MDAPTRRTALQPMLQAKGTTMTARYRIESDHRGTHGATATHFRFTCLAPGCTRVSAWLTDEHLAISIAEAHHAAAHDDWSAFAEAVQKMPRSST